MICDEEMDCIFVLEEMIKIRGGGGGQGDHVMLLILMIVLHIINDICIN